MKAIILTAGDGKRLRPLTKDIPKGLLKIKDRTILEYQIDALNDCGIKDILLVVGHGAKRVKEIFGDRVKYAYNPRYKSTNNIFSLWMARGEIKNNNCLCLHSDVLFHKIILEDIIEHKGDICLSVKKSDKRQMIRVKVQNGLVIEINKSMPLKEAYGNFIGISKFSKEVSSIFLEETEKYIKKNRTSVFYSAPINELIRIGIKVYPVLTRNLPWCDIDDANDYERAKRILGRFF